jgi:hypothetical protein
MNKEEYLDWCNKMGYLTITDWNYQIVGKCHYYFILNPTTDKFALIKFIPMRVGTGYPDRHEVLVQDWTDFNGYAEQFHKETEGAWK